MKGLNSFLWISLAWFLAVAATLSGIQLTLLGNGSNNMVVMVFVILGASLLFTYGLSNFVQYAGLRYIKDDFTFEVSPEKKCCGSCAWNRGEKQCNAACSCCPSGYNGAPKTQFEYLNLSDGNWENSQTC